MLHRSFVAILCLWASFYISAAIAGGAVETPKVKTSELGTLSPSAGKPTVPQTSPVVEGEKAKARLETLGMVTGPATGTYFRFGNDIKTLAKSLDIEMNIKESRGSIENITRINSRENAALGIVQSDVLSFLNRVENKNSEGMLENLRLVFPLYPEEVHVLAKKELKNFHDLNGKTVAIGPKGSGGWLTAINLLRILDIIPGRLIRMTEEEALVAVLRGRADAMITVAGKPVRLFQNMNSLKDYQDYVELLDSVHLLPLDDPRLLREYVSATITEGDYEFVDEPVKTVAVTSALVSYHFSDEEDFYAETRCRQIRALAQGLRNALPDLQKNGHPKWQQVALDAEITGVWKQDSCAVEDSNEAALAQDLLNSLSD